MKTITLPLDEYNDLIKAKEEKDRLIKEIETDAEQRGYVVFKKYLFTRDDLINKYMWQCSIEGELEIYTKDEVIIEAKKQLESMKEALQNIIKDCENLRNENERLKKKGLLKRIFNI